MVAEAVIRYSPDIFESQLPRDMRRRDVAVSWFGVAPTKHPNTKEVVVVSDDKRLIK